MSRIYTGAEARALREAATAGAWAQSYREGTPGSFRMQVYPDADADNTIATLHWHSVKTSSGHITDRDANAILIAAAPDLCRTIEALEARAVAAEARCAVLEDDQDMIKAAVVNLLTAARNDLQAMFEQGVTE